MADGSHKPTGSALATGTIDCSAITQVTTGEDKTVTFGSAYGATGDTEYVLVADRASVTQGSIYVCYSASGNRGVYSVSADNGSSYTIDSTKDKIFSVYGTSSSSGLYQGILRMAIWLVPVGVLLAV